MDIDPHWFVPLPIQERTVSNTGEPLMGDFWICKECATAKLLRDCERKAYRFHPVLRDTANRNIRLRQSNTRVPAVRHCGPRFGVSQSQAPRAPQEPRLERACGQQCVSVAFRSGLGFESPQCPNAARGFVNASV